MVTQNPEPIAVVTGASSGIGAATARLLAGEGWQVVLVARRQERLQSLADEIESVGGEAAVEALDAADGEAVAAMGQRVVAEIGTPELVVNCAGAGVWKFLEETSPGEIRQMLGAPFLAAANTSRAFMSAMIDARRGLLLHVGSPASLMPWPGATAYTSSRWALRGLHEALCVDLVGTGVTSSMVYFGEVSSEYFEANPDSRQYIPSIGRFVPLSTPEACAEVILDVAHRPRRVVFYPFQLRLMWWMARISPAPTRWLITRTGRRH